MSLKIALLPLFLLALAPLAFAGTIAVYDNIPSSLPNNLPSEGYEAMSMGEIGGLIQFAGGDSTYSLASATVDLSDWAPASDWASAINGTTITANGFYVPLTLNLYTVGANNTVGALIASETVDAFIAWRPAATSTCGSNYLGSDGACHGGSLSTVTFDLAGVTTSDEIIYGVSLNTEDFGSDPTGVAGPYNSLNFALSTTLPSVGSEPLLGTAYWETMAPYWYADGGAGGVGTFRQDTGWSPYSGAVEFDQESDSTADSGLTEAPEPSSLLLLGTGLFGLAALLYPRFRLSRAVVKLQ
jgi:hypothetical protein